MKLNIFLIGLLFILGSCKSIKDEKASENNSLRTLKEKINEGNYPKSNAIIISQNDSILFEEYFNGYGKDSLQDVRSSTKSITALLAGIAIDKGFIKNIKDPIFNYLPQYNETNLNNWNKLKASITIEDLLTMRTGIGCEQFFGDMGFPDCEEIMFDHNDWVKYGLDQEMAFKPGEKWLYTGTAPMIMGAIINEASGKSIDEFALEYLFKPLEITNGYRWSKNPKTGRVFTAGNLYVTPMNMVKIGNLVINDGKWKDKQIISASTINQIITPKLILPNDYSFFLTAGDVWENQQAAEYGFYWYTEKIKIGSRELLMNFTFGNGGNYIVLVPELNNLVIVFTGSNYGKPIINKQPFDMMFKYIIPHFISKTETVTNPNV